MLFGLVAIVYTALVSYVCVMFICLYLFGGEPELHDVPPGTSHTRKRAASTRGELARRGREGVALTSVGPTRGRGPFARSGLG